MQNFKIKPYHKLIAGLVLAVLVFFIVRHALPKPKMLAIILSSIVLFDVWIDYWIRTNVETRYATSLPLCTTKIFLRVFNVSIVCFLLMILALWIKPLHQWFPLFRIYIYGLVLVVVALKMGLALFLFLQFLISKIKITNKFSSPKRWFQAGLWMISILFVITLYGTLYGAYDLRVDQIEIRDNAVPKGFDGYKIVQFSDMHIGSFGLLTESYIQKLIKTINDQEPDLVVFTGDMINFTSFELGPFLTHFSNIQAKDGIYVVLGNHDYNSYVNWKNSQDSLKLMNLLMSIYQESLGWNVLQNEHVWIHRGNDSIALAGVENYSSQKIKRWVNLADTERALKGIFPENFIVMLSHNPEHFNEELQPNFPHVNLTLTGHSHGGQMAIGNLSIARLAMDYWQGFHHIDGQYLNVNTGAGFNALPFRINMPPSISVITLKSE
jgi:predicted MPP superfamily phosphohydrolase